MSPRPANPDPEALTIAVEMQRRLQPAEVILLGSRAAGDHRPDSDVDLMAVALDENGKREADGILRRLLEGKYDVPVVNVNTITREEFRRTAPLAQSQAGQAARHGVTPEGGSLNYVPEGKPETGEIRRETVFWLMLAEREVRAFAALSESERFTDFQMPALHGQWALERALKGLLTSDNDPSRFRRDAARLWRYIERVRPVLDRKGAREMEELLRATAGPDGQRCRLTEFSEAFRRGDVMPELSGLEQAAVRQHLALAVNMLIAEALARSGGTREDMEEARHRRGSGPPG